MDQTGDRIPKQDSLKREDPKVSETVGRFLEYLRVEFNRLPGTLGRYEAHLQRFIDAAGDRSITAIDVDCVSLYKRRLMDAGLAPATMSATIGCYRLLSSARPAPERRV